MTLFTNPAGRGSRNGQNSVARGLKAVNGQGEVTSAGGCPLARPHGHREPGCQQGGHNWPFP
eukprot:3406679-Pyramimonas_sp.AAC.2